MISPIHNQRTACGALSSRLPRAATTATAAAGLGQTRKASQPVATRPAASRWRTLLVASLSLGAAASGAFAQASSTAATSQASIEKAVMDVLKSRPELVREAMARLEQRDAEARARTERKALAQSGKQLMSTTGATVLGNPAGDVTLVEFIDYRCGYCKSLSANIDALLQRDKQLRVLVKHLPILGSDSVAAASLMLTTGKDADLPRLHRTMMSAPQLDAAALQNIAQGLPTSAAKSGGDAVAAQKELADVAALAERLGIQGTPAIIVGDQIFRGAVDLAQLEAAVQASRRLTRSKAVAGL